MRIFIGIDFDKKHKEQLAKLQQLIVSKCSGGVFTAAENFHLTLHFIGEIEKDQLGAIERGLAQGAKETEAFDLTLQGFGTFRKGRTAIPWLGVQEGIEPLNRLHHSLGNRLETIGYKKESRPFHPHVTFGRKVRLRTVDEQELEEVLGNQKVRVRVASFEIMESLRKEEKLIYPVLTKFTLKQSALKKG